MSIKHNIKAILTTLTLGLPVVASATNGDQLLGVTAIQWGMGGAVVAAPQDAATIFVNPAGLSELGMEEVRFDLSPGFMNPPREANGTKSDSDLFFLPSGSVAFKSSDKTYYGIGLAAQSGFGVDFNDVLAAPGNQHFVTTKGLFKISPSVGYKINDKLSFGASINIAYQSLAMNMSNPMASINFPQNQQFGYGFTLGTIYKINDKLQFGASWVTKTDIAEHEFNTSEGKFSLDMDVAQQLTVGLAYKPDSSLLIEADVKWINHSDTMDSVTINRPAGYAGTVPAKLNFGWDDQIVLAVGVQKTLNPKTDIRFGLNYGESPIGPEDVDQNIGSLAIPELHLSAGVTRKLTKKTSGSLSYTKAFENTVTSNSGSGNTISIEQNVVYAQISYQF